MRMETYRDSYMPCQSNFDPYPNEEWEEQRQAAIETLADSIEIVLAKMGEYWTKYITSGHQEPAGYHDQKDLLEWMNMKEEAIMFQMLGIDGNDDEKLPSQPKTKDVCDLAKRIAERLIDAEVYSIN